LELILAFKTHRINTESGELDRITDVGDTVDPGDPSGFTEGSVIFAGNAVLAEDNANLFWDDANNRLGLGTASPQTQLHVGTQNTGLTAFDNYINGATVDSIYGNFDVNNGRLSIAGNTSAGFEMVDKTAAVNSKWAQVLLFDNNLVFRGIDDDGSLGYNLIVAETDTGNVGIGTDSPSYLLDVDGDARFDEIYLDETTSKITIDHVDVPDVSGASLSTSATGGTIAAGTWYVTITYGDTNNKHETNQSLNIGPVVTTGSTSTITINDLPVSPNAQVSRRNIYLGTSSTYQYHQAAQAVTNNVDTSATLTSYTSILGNDMHRMKYNTTHTYGNTMGGYFENSEGQELFHIGNEGQFYMIGERSCFVFPQKNVSGGFDPLPFYLFRETTIPIAKDDYGYASFFYDVNDGSALKIGHFGRGAYTQAPVEVHGDQPGVEFNAVISRGSASGWFRFTDGGTSTTNVDLVRYSNTNWTGSSGVNTLLRMDGASNQSGSAGYILFDIDFTNSGFSGSGVEELINFKTGGTSRFKVEAAGNVISTGDTYWTGDGSGIAYGHMYTNSTIATTLTDQNTWYELDGATAWTTGELNLCTFTDPEITVTKAGRYEVIYTLSTDFSATPGAAQQLEYGIMVNGTIQNEGQAHRTLANSTDTGHCSGVAILDLAADDDVSLAARNVSSAGKILHVEHGNMTIKMVGGT
jgi:hypothetical protein